jgi:hypothetical protein
MANINKIRLSGQTYSIQDENATKTLELTQAQYDALTVKDPNTFYIITDATAGDLTAIENRLSEDEEVTAAGLNALNESKQDTLVSGTNIKTINNESILGSGNIDIQGGGKAIEAGRGISITTGETADTVSFSLPISAGTGTNSIQEGGSTTASGNYSHSEGYNTTASGYFGSHAEGYNTTASGYYGSHAEGTNTKASGNYSHTEGQNTSANGKASHAEGYFTNATNESEHASGQYNVSSKASTTFGNSGNTLFSVGNGTANNARHNAFEIRQNGDIYITKDGQDVKLQDQLGGSSITVDTALSSTSENPVQNKALYDELRIIGEPTETILQWEQHDGGESTNYPSGCTKITVEVDENEMTYGSYTLYNNNYDCFGVFVIESNGGVITVSARDCESEPTTSITYSISGNVVTVEYPTIANVTIIGTAYDNYWVVKAIGDNVTPLIDQVTANTTRLAEDEEVTAAGLNAVNDKFDGLKLKKLSQAAYDNLQVKDQNTLYIIVN